MVLWRRNGGTSPQAVIYVTFLLFALVASQDKNVAASTGTPMTVAPPFLAVTPASALAPSSGNGPVIVGYGFSCKTTPIAFVTRPPPVADLLCRMAH